MCVHVCIDSVDIDSIESISNLMPVSTVSTCMCIWYGWKALILSCPKLFLDGKSIEY